MITFEIKDGNKISDGLAELEIYCDLEGIKELQKQLYFLLEGETHIHLATPAWAGNELNEKKMGDKNILINQITLIKINS